MDDTFIDAINRARKFEPIPTTRSRAGEVQSVLNDFVWKPALVKVAVTPEPPAQKVRGHVQYATDREHGMHALRHYYASVLLADGVSIKELAEYLGHADPGFTLRVYRHMLPGSHDRAIKAIDRRIGGAVAVLSTSAEQSIVWRNRDGTNRGAGSATDL